MSETYCQIKPKLNHNYVAFFLSFSCNLKCPYCINLHDNVKRAQQVKRDYMPVEKWIAAANRLVLREDLPLTLQGGEPTQYPDFFRVVNILKELFPSLYRA